jgi:hypothetical protein
MAEFISKIPGNLTEYPNAFKRQGAFPLEAYSVFASVAEAETYAQTNPLAYVGQVIAVTYKTTEIVGEETVTTEHARLYIIRTESGALLELGSTESIDHDFAEVWEVLNNWAPFFEDKESLDKAYDTLKELQDYIDEHGDDFTALYADVKEIYHAEYEVDENGEYVLEDGKKKIISETGLLVEEREARLEAEAALEKAIADETDRANKADKTLIEKIEEIYTPERTEGEGEEATTIPEDGVLVRKLGDLNGKTVKAYVDDSIAGIPIATAQLLGLVKSSTAQNFVKVHEDGTMEVNSLNVMKLEQTAGDLLLLDGGDANGINN